MASRGKLEREREKLLEEMGSLGPMRRGSLVERYLPCGKPGCHCQRPGSRGHGPKYSLTYKVKGRTKTEYVLVERAPQVRQQLKNHARFLELSKRLVEVGEQMSQLDLEGETTVSKKNSARRSKRKSRKRSTVS